MKHTVYIDGQAGTTGLQLRHKLERHDAVELLLISEEKRKDEAERKRLMNSAEVVFLCLPDEAGFFPLIGFQLDNHSVLRIPAVMRRGLLRRFTRLLRWGLSGRITH